MMRHLIELSAQGIEALAVAIIVVAIAHGTIRYLFHINRQVGGAYEQYKVQLGKALLLGLEFLVAADIVRTVALELTLHNVMILGLLVIVRTFLSWSLVVEVEGRWPWRAQAETHSRGANEPVGDRARHCSTGSAGS
jgi:uncharacterized membrane protein